MLWVPLNMAMSAAHCQGNVTEFQSVWRVVTLRFKGYTECLLCRTQFSSVCIYPLTIVVGFCSPGLCFGDSLEQNLEVLRCVLEHFRVICQWNNFRNHSVFSNDVRAATWSLKSSKVPFLNTWSLMSLNLKKWSLKSLFLCNWLSFNLSWLNFAFIFYIMDTLENSVQRNCVDNMTLNSLELRTGLLHAFD